MNPEKDYYSILGVMPDAEQIVIKAAFRALAQRYHPDRFAGPEEKANAVMAELNEAFAVLSDPVKRAAYDKIHGSRTEAGNSRLIDMEEKAPPGEDPLDTDWKVAVSYYPDLASLENRLGQYSWKLSNTYRAYLLETKQFEDRCCLADLMEHHFLETYFGDNPKILGFAQALIIGGRREAAQALNNTIRVLGVNADPARVIWKIARDFDARHLAADRQKISTLVPIAREPSAATSVFLQMLKELGGIAVPGIAAEAEETRQIAFDGKDLNFKSEYDFRAWFRKEVLPMAERMTKQ